MKNLCKNLLILNLLCSSFILFGCNNQDNTNNNDNKDNTGDNDNKDNTDNNDDNKDNTGDNDNIKETTIKSTDFTNVISAEKTTDGVYLKNDTEDTIGDFTFNFSNTIVGISGNQDYLNCLQFKKGSNNLFTLNTTKTITKIVVTSLKNTAYDTAYGYFTLKNNGTDLLYKNEETKNKQISTITSTYTLENSSINGEIIFNNNTDRAIYMSSITVYSK